MSDAQELSYLRGSKEAWTNVLRMALHNLAIDPDNLDAAKAAWILERRDTVAKLREMCDIYGDNDWDDDLHLADVIEAHLCDHLEDSE